MLATFSFYYLFLVLVERLFMLFIERTNLQLPVASGQTKPVDLLGVLVLRSAFRAAFRPKHMPDEGLIDLFIRKGTTYSNY